MKKIYSQIPLMRCHLVITSVRIRDELISVSGQLAVLKGKWLDGGKPQNPHVIIIFIILVSEMTKASESSISFSAQQGFKLDIPDRNSYIMSHVYIKHGFTWSNKTLNYNVAKQNIISFLHSGKKTALPCFPILHLCLTHLFPLQH